MNNDETKSKERFVPDGDINSPRNGFIKRALKKAVAGNYVSKEDANALYALLSKIYAQQELTGDEVLHFRFLREHTKAAIIRAKRDAAIGVQPNNSVTHEAFPPWNWTATITSAIKSVMSCMVETNAELHEE